MSSAAGEIETMGAEENAKRRSSVPALEVAHLGLRYGRHIILTDFNLRVEESNFVCLLGPSGCGKTSVLKLVAGLIEPQTGTILVDGTPIKGPGTERSMVFQNYGLLPWRTVLGNVELGLEIRGVSRRDRRAIALKEIERIGLFGYQNHFPNQLSGGMQQRVGLARAFTKNPRILLMDEPFAAVDMQTREYLQDELLKVWEQVKTTVLFVTHSIDEAIYLGDRVVVLSAHGGETRLSLDIDLPRPRYETDIKASRRFGELRHLIREALRGQ
jgi:ABC-type nitrate/sulfonate/bicarbonate transport system ATPase subunit